ncbi:MAG TPA: hypothetical protein VD908_13690 [Cytophagales bacterium]|nr:hypothetical protein [Cytophagales bacterium]
MIELAPGIFLHAFQNSSDAKSQLDEETKDDSEIVFKGELSLLMELASRYVMSIGSGRYKDYFYNSTGFSAPTMSLQSAIWATESILNPQNPLSYFIILKKIKTLT